MKKGFLECPEMPHAETLKMLNMMDFIRHQLNVVYPCEMPIVQTVQESVKAAEQPAVESTVDNIAGSAVEDTIENAVENTADHGSEEE